MFKILFVVLAASAFALARPDFVCDGECQLREQERMLEEERMEIERQREREEEMKRQREQEMMMKEEQMMMEQQRLWKVADATPLVSSAGYIPIVKTTDIGKVDWFVPGVKSPLPKIAEGLPTYTLPHVFSQAVVPKTLLPITEVKQPIAEISLEDKHHEFRKTPTFEAVKTKSSDSVVVEAKPEVGLLKDIKDTTEHGHILKNFGTVVPYTHTLPYAPVYTLPLTRSIPATHGYSYIAY